MRIISNTIPLVVSSSCTVNVIPKAAKEGNQYAKTDPRAIIKVRGPLALSGKKGLRISSSSLPSAAGGNWAISFWIQIMQSANGKFRSLFYKGDGHSGDRTPSAWLRPDVNGVSARVTSNRSTDVGADSISTALPIKVYSISFYVQHS